MAGLKTKVGLGRPAGRGIKQKEPDRQPSTSTSNGIASNPSSSGNKENSDSDQSQRSDSKKWTLLKCWSKRMFEAFRTHISSEHLEYSRRGLGKKFYTTIHGQKRKISIDDPEFQIFEIVKIGELQNIGHAKAKKLQIESSEIKCANNMESGRPIPTWTLICHLELADVMQEALHIGDYFAVWGAKYTQKSRAVILNSFDEIQVPETVMVIYRHESTFDPAEKFDRFHIPSQEQNMSHFLLQADDSGICDLVQEIVPKPKRKNGEAQQAKEGDNDSPLSDAEEDSEEDDQAAKNHVKSPRSSPRRPTTPVPPRPSEKTTSPKIPSAHKQSTLSHDAILEELELESETGGIRDRSRSSSCEIIADIPDSDTDERPARRKPNNNSRTSARKLDSAKPKKKPGIIESDSEIENSENDESDPPFLPGVRSKQLKRQVTRRISGSSCGSLTSPRPKRAARDKANKASVVEISDSEEEFRRPTAPAPSKGRDEVDEDRKSEGEERHATRSSPRKANRNESNRSQGQGESSKQADSESQTLSQSSIVIQLETQNFGRPSNSKTAHRDEDKDSDWQPSGSDNEKGKSDKSNDSDDDSPSDDSDEESLETKRQKLNQSKVVRKLSFPEESRPPGKRAATSSDWSGRLLQCSIKLNREIADAYLPPSLSKPGNSKSNKSSRGNKRRR